VDMGNGATGDADTSPAAAGERTEYLNRNSGLLLRAES
jgi:hypothetical protein